MNRLISLRLNSRMKIIATFLLTMLCVASAECATNQPPRYRLQRIEDWDDYGHVRTLLLNINRAV